MQDSLGSPDSVEDVCGLVCFTLQRPSAVVAAISGCFTVDGAGQPELAIATCDRVQCFTFDEEFEAKLLWSVDHPAILALHLIKGRY